MPPTATSDRDPRHSHEYGPRGRARFTCTLCGSVDTENLFSTLETAEKQADDIYGAWQQNQRVLMAFKHTLGLDPFRKPDEDPMDHRLVTAVATALGEPDEALDPATTAAARAAITEVGKRLKTIEAEYDER